MSELKDVKSAAHALNDRSGCLDFEVSVMEGDDIEEGLVNSKDREKLMGEKPNESDGRRRPGGFCSCFTLAYYEPYFDVDTIDVQQRLFRALVPLKKNPAFFELILSAPDAYGPFWVSTTLIFCLASCSNVASYLDVVGDRSGWSYDFSRLASAYTLVETFLFGLPILLWIFGKYVGIPMSHSFLMCLYGYSITVYILACIICMAPIDALDWVVLLLSMVSSLFFLTTNLWSVVGSSSSNEKMIPLLAFISRVQTVDDAESIADHVSQASAMRKEYTTDLMNTSENEIVLTIDYAQNLSVLRHRVGGTFYLLFQYHFSVTSTTTSELCVTPLKVQ